MPRLKLTCRGNLGFSSSKQDGLEPGFGLQLRGFLLCGIGPRTEQFACVCVCVFVFLFETGFAARRIGSSSHTDSRSRGTCSSKAAKASTP